MLQIPEKVFILILSKNFEIALYTLPKISMASLEMSIIFCYLPYLQIHDCLKTEIFCRYLSSIFLVFTKKQSVPKSS